MSWSIGQVFLSHHFYIPEIIIPVKSRLCGWECLEGNFAAGPRAKSEPSGAFGSRWELNLKFHPHVSIHKSLVSHKIVIPLWLYWVVDALFMWERWLVTSGWFAAQWRHFIQQIVLIHVESVLFSKPNMGNNYILHTVLAREGEMWLKIFMQGWKISSLNTNSKEEKQRLSFLFWKQNPRKKI